MDLFSERTLYEGKMKKFFSKFDATFEQPQANFIGKVFNVGRQTVTVDEMIAEGESMFQK